MSSASLAIELSSDVHDSDNESEPRSPSPIPQPAGLEDAIGNASAATLRMLMKKICRQNTAAHKVASEVLLVSTPATTTGKRQRYETCMNCEEEYDVQVNEKGMCVYHPGSKEVDGDSDT
ncbi:hypothetical protein LTR56_008264 [Elasticomyces elasticus]|nr:hypothetical protein LTR56_008264 [Elasticomyces elasticus]KAK3661827.1 hypothetical protein LTR22_007410 [Elasticomyces elasticus]KAK4924431.1 hypothetical protein LTR49_008522 [Elasticomyces elasticus]KAK5762604.1 hypothetical protein LTS12_007194 [Elasticomyces elasticus]